MLGVYTPPEALYDGETQSQLLFCTSVKLQIFQLIFDLFFFFYRISFFPAAFTFSYFYIEISTQCKCPNCIKYKVGFKKEGKKMQFLQVT